MFIFGEFYSGYGLVDRKTEEVMTRYAHVIR